MLLYPWTFHTDEKISPIVDGKICTYSRELIIFNRDRRRRHSLILALIKRILYTQYSRIFTQ